MSERFGEYLLKNNYPGTLISFEGIDGAGKSCQSNLLAGFLENSGKQVVLTKSPGGTDLNAKLRKVIFDDSDGEKWHTLPEFLLFCADRAQHLESMIKPALQSGKIVICDRYVHSMYVYQHKNGVSKDYINALDEMTETIEPDLTFFIDAEPESIFQRLMNRANSNHYDRHDIEFYKDLTKRYRDIMVDCRYCKTIKPTSIQDTHNRIRHEITEFLIQ